jgi:creatinine amidohydrolase/Fe(II)-dependent formamide hydrolase-like protein
MSLVMGDMLVSLVSQGFRNVYLFLCHGGSENARALDDAIKILLRTNPAFENVMVALMPIWDCDVKKTSYRKGFAEKDWHAGWVETSIMMAVAPELVHMEELALDEEPFLQMQIEHPDNYQHAEKIVDDPMVIPRQRQRDGVKIGVMGFPEKASVEIGRKGVEDIVAFASQKIAELDSKADGIYKEVSFTPLPLIF